MLSSLVVAVAADDDQATSPAESTTAHDGQANALLRSWPSFRGPHALGRTTLANPPLKWNVKDGTGIRWKIALPKHGMSSPVVWSDRIYLTGADEDSRQLYCVDADTGKLLWQHDLKGVPGSPDDGKIPDVMEEAGFAAPTPATNGKFVGRINTLSDTSVQPNRHHAFQPSSMTRNQLVYRQLVSLCGLVE